VEGRAEKADEVGQRTDEPDGVAVGALALQRQLDYRREAMVAYGLGNGFRGGRENELRIGVEKLEEELGQPLHRWRARDDEETHG
jgi:hypothetical protein